MNYFGKFDAKVSDALGQHPSAHLYSETVHANHVPADAIVVPDAQLLFNADFKRTGVDLVLSGDGREVVLHDYFKGEHRAAIASPDGAHLTGDLVNALAGDVQYAQADGNNADAHKVIGHVTKLVGTATAVRNGVSIILNNGDNVEKGDVVSSGADSTLGITFIDGTVFGLSSNARMVLNEMVYDPNGSNNSSLLSLVAGTITFVAGETAKHGDMKVDTPVATMGIRGTAVLVEIDFSVPGAAPDAKFQVLVEPDGTTGSYILFDKTTLTPLAVVDRAGTQINISNGIMSQTLAPLSPEIQKLINDVFTLKFTDNTNTKSLDHFTDSIIPTDGFGLFKFGSLNNNAPTIPVIVNLVVAESANAGATPSTKNHVPVPPTIQSGAIVASITEQLNQTGLKSADLISGHIQYSDVNTTDHDTLSVKFSSFTYQNAKGQDVTASLNSLQLKDIANVEATIGVAEPLTPDGNGNATATWSYSVADKNFDFLAAGEKLTLTYTATVDNNYQQVDQVSAPQTFTITITGTNDVPVITSSQQNIQFVPSGTDTKGGELIPDTATTGKLAFTDPDLTDTHTVSVKMASALLDGKDLSATVGQVVIDELSSALTAKITAADDSTGTGAGTIEWTLADLQVYLADVVPANETLVLTYAVTVTDSQGATDTQNVVVTIGGNQPAATVWIDTTPIPSGGVALWSDAANWESDRVPTIGDDVFIGTDQMLPGTPVFPATVNADAQAKSLTMDYFTDFGTSIPELDVNSGVTLTIAGALKLDTSTDSSSPLTAESIIKNWGTISVGGIAELLKHSVLDNYGTFYLAQGGEFAGQSSITNSGTIEIASDTLDVAVDIVNSVTTTAGSGAEGLVANAATITTAGTIKVDAGATLLLEDGGGIIGGNLKIASGGIVEITYGQDGTVSANGGILDGVHVTNDGTIQVDGPVAADPTTTPATLATPAATLTLDDGTAIIGGSLTIASGATLDIEAGNIGPGATLDGVTVSGTGGDAPSTIEVGHSGAATLLLDDGTTITGGHLTIAGGSTLDVEAGESGPGAALHGVTVSGTSGDGHSVIEIGNSGAATLLLDDGTIITNGNLNIAGGSTLDVEAGTIDPGATLDSVTVSGTGGDAPSTIEVGASGAATLLLDDGTTITNGGLTISAGSAVDVEAGKVGPGATLDGVAVSGASGDNPSVIAVGGSGGPATLVLDDGTAITNGNLSIAGGSTLDVEAGTAGPGATLDGVTVTGADADAELSAPASVIEVGNSGAATLLLDDGTTITGGNLTIASGSTVDVESANGATLDGVTVSGTNDPSTIEIGNSGAATLLLDDGTTITNGNLTIAGGSTLDVEAGTGGPGATLDGVAVGGTSGDSASIIEVGVLGAATLLLDDGTTVANGNLNILGGSTLDIEAGESGPGATLDGVTVHGVDAIDEIAASTIEVGTSGAATLLLDDGTTITNGNLTIAGGSTLDVEAGTTGPGATLDGVKVSGTSGDSHSVIEIGNSGAATLLLDNGTTITGGNLTIAAGSTLDVEAGTAGPGATLDGVTVSGTSGDSHSVIEIGNAGAATLLLDDGTIITNGNLNIAGGSTLDVESGKTGPGATLDGVTVIGTDADAEPSVLASSIEVGTLGAATLLLDDGTTIANGDLTIGLNGTLDIESSAGATLDGVNVTNNGTIEVDGPVRPPEIVNLVLDDGTIITGGKLVINPLQNGAEGTVEIGAGGATFDDVTVTNNVLTIDQPAMLTIDGGTTINGGTIHDYGALLVTAASTIENATVDGGGNLTATTAALTLSGVTLDDVTLSGSFTNADTLTIDETVTLNGATISGGTIDDAGTLNVTTASEIENATVDGGGDITATAAALTLSGVTLDDVTLAGSFTNADTLTIDETVTLNGATISGGTIDDTGTLKVTTASEIENATVDGGGDITATAAALTLSGVTLDDVTLSGSFTDADTLTIDETVTLNGVTLSGGTIDDAGTLKVASASTIENATVDGGGDITATAAALTLSGVTLDDVTLAGSFTNADTLTVDETVTLNGATISGGTIDDTGTLKVTTASEIENATVDGGGNLTATTAALTLSRVTLDDVTLSGSFTNADTLTIDDIVTLNSATISGGTLDISGTLDSTGTSSITGATIDNSGNVNVVSGTLTIDPATFTNTGTVEVDGKASLVLSGETVSNSTTVGQTTTDGTIQIDSQGLLTLSNSAINGGIVDNLGTIDVTAASSINNTFNFDNTGTVNADGATLTLSGTTITNANGTLESTGSGLLKLVNTTINNGSLAGKIATATGNGSSTLNAVTLELATLVTATVGVLELTGLITNNGEIDASGGTVDLVSSTIDFGTLGGSGAITTVSGLNTLDGVTISHGTTVTVADHTTMELVGTITDSGTIALGSSGHTTQLEISGSVSLAGGGSITMTDVADSSGHVDNFIVSDGSAATLTNSDTISGAGTIGDSHLTLINSGTIDATGTHPLIINTGVTNDASGVLEASAGSTLDINGNVVNDGTIAAGASAHVTITGNVSTDTGDTGNINISAHAVVEVTGTVDANQTVTFEQANGAGLLVLDDSHGFAGKIVGLTEANPENTENHVDLLDLASPTQGQHYSVKTSGNGGPGETVTISVVQGSHVVDSVTLHVSGNSDPSFEVAPDGHGGTLLDDPASTGVVTIDSDHVLDVSGANSATITFTNTSGNTGELLLDDSHDFTGLIAGFTGDGTIANSDLIDITDINFANVATDKTTYTENAAGTGGTLTLHDANGQVLDNLNFTGNYQLANFTVENDGNGGTLIFDPPVNTSSPAPASTVVASAANQTLSGTAASENFVFNFANVGQSTISNFHAATDTLQFGATTFADAQAALNAVHDDGHGNSVLVIDAHDSITLTGVLKAQLHVNDFHIV